MNPLLSLDEMHFACPVLFCQASFISQKLLCVIAVAFIMRNMIYDIPSQVLDHYVAIRDLPDGRTIGVARLIFHYTLHVGIDWCGYADRYCFATKELAMAAFHAWDGNGDPDGWHRHPMSGRRRDLASGKEWIEF